MTRPPAVHGGLRTGAALEREPLLRRGLERVLRGYMRIWHSLEVVGREHLPATGPALMLANHTSILDVIALAAVNPYPHATTVIKASAFRVPVVRQVLAAWGAIPVERDGHDISGARALLTTLRSGRVIGVAAEGRRSRDGRLQPINLVLARIAVRSAVPIIPVGITGSYSALPPGSIVPKRHKIVLRVGPTFVLPRNESPEAAARCIRDAIVALLPEAQQSEVALQDAAGKDA